MHIDNAHMEVVAESVNNLSITSINDFSFVVFVNAISFIEKFKIKIGVVMAMPIIKSFIISVDKKNSYPPKISR